MLIATGIDIKDDTSKLATNPVVGVITDPRLLIEFIRKNSKVRALLLTYISVMDRMIMNCFWDCFCNHLKENNNEDDEYYLHRLKKKEFVLYQDDNNKPKTLGDLISITNISDFIDKFISSGENHKPTNDNENNKNIQLKWIDGSDIYLDIYYNNANLLNNKQSLDIIGTSRFIKQLREFWNFKPSKDDHKEFKKNCVEKFLDKLEERTCLYSESEKTNKDQQFDAFEDTIKKLQNLRHFMTHFSEKEGVTTEHYFEALGWILDTLPAKFKWELESLMNSQWEHYNKDSKDKNKLVLPTIEPTIRRAYKEKWEKYYGKKYREKASIEEKAIRSKPQIKHLNDFSNMKRYFFNNKNIQYYAEKNILKDDIKSIQPNKEAPLDYNLNITTSQKAFNNLLLDKKGNKKITSDKFKTAVPQNSDLGRSEYIDTYYENPKIDPKISEKESKRTHIGSINYPTENLSKYITTEEQEKIVLLFLNINRVFQEFFVTLFEFIVIETFFKDNIKSEEGNKEFDYSTLSQIRNGIAHSLLFTKSYKNNDNNLNQFDFKTAVEQVLGFMNHCLDSKKNQHLLKAWREEGKEYHCKCKKNNQLPCNTCNENGKKCKCNECDFCKVSDSKYKQRYIAEFKQSLQGLFHTKNKYDLVAFTKADVENHKPKKGKKAIVELRRIKFITNNSKTDSSVTDSPQTKPNNNSERRRSSRKVPIAEQIKNQIDKATNLYTIESKEEGGRFSIDYYYKDNSHLTEEELKLKKGLLDKIDAQIKRLQPETTKPTITEFFIRRHYPDGTIKPNPNPKADIFQVLKSLKKAKQAASSNTEFYIHYNYAYDKVLHYYDYLLNGAYEAYDKRKEKK